MILICSSKLLFANDNTIESPCSINLLNIQNVNCYGGINGLVEVSGTGGSMGAYHYTISSLNSSLNLWVQFAQSPSLGLYTSSNVTFPLLSSDSLRIIMNDSLGCGDTLYFSITQPNSPISTTYNIINSTSLFSNDGSISIIVNGGTPHYLYSWNGPNGFTSNNQNINNLYPGSYVLLVTDSVGCTDTQTVVVSSNQNPIIDPFTATTPVCEGDPVMATMTLIQGAPPVTVTYSYNGQNYNEVVGVAGQACPIVVNVPLDMTNLNVGSNTISTISVADGLNNCPANLLPPAFDVVINPTPSVTSTTIINSSLQGVCDGSIFLTAGGGNSPYHYLWSTGDSTSYIDSLCSDFYCADITDNNGCSVAWCDSIITLDSCITDIQVDVLLSSETCWGQDGSITIFANQGNPPYFYSLDGGFFFSSTSFSDTVIIGALSSANYNISIIDSLGCVKHYGNVLLDLTSNPSIDSVITQNESCCGNDGQLFIFGSSSSLITQYSLDTSNSWQSVPNFDSLSMGTYVVSIQDNNGCFDTDTVQLYADSIPDINVATEHTDIICNGDTNGTLKVRYPNSCYEYTLWRYTLFTPQVVVDTGIYFNELISGFYGVIATSNSGYCIDSSVVRYVQEPDIITYSSPFVKAVDCISNDSCNGSIQLLNSPSGGVSPYHYYITELFSNFPLGPISTDSIFLGLCPNNYLIDVVDANACIIQDTATIIDSSLYIDSIIQTTVSCFGFDDGSAIAYASGGIGNLSYLWSNSQNTQFIDSLSRGIYTLTVVDSIGCHMRDSIFIDHPDTLLFKIRENGKIPETCFGLSHDGQIVLDIYGGTSPYTHSWTSSSGLSGLGLGDTIFNLTADTIMLYVQDTNGCIASPSWGTINITILQALNQSNPLSINTEANTYPICYGSHDGEININVLNGDSPYQFSIDGGLSLSSDSIFLNLLAGNYNIVVLDTYGCSDSIFVRIEEYTEIIIDIDSIKHVSCYEGSDGYISISPSQGTGDYTYLWSPTLDTTSIISNLEAYVYTVNVIDSAGCSRTDTISISELTDPIQSIETIIQNVQCYAGSDASASIQVIGGMPFEDGSYIYYWIDTENDTVSWSHLANNLESGLFTVVVTDSFNCGPFIDTVNIEEPSRFVLSVTTIKDNICFGDSDGEITVQPNGGSLNYSTFSLLGSNSFVTQNFPVFENLEADIFSIWATDSNGCFSDTVEGVKLGEPGRFQINTLIQEPQCFNTIDGSLETIIIGGTSPYDYVLMDGNDSINTGIMTQGNAKVIYNLYAGSFTWNINDMNNCSFDTLLEIPSSSQVISDFSSDVLYGSIYGNIPLSINFTNYSIGADNFIWDFNDDQELLISSSTNEVIQYVFNKPGQYAVSLIASNSVLDSICNDTSFVIINIEGYNMYNVFTPNGDEWNNTFNFNDLGLTSLEVQIFNRWGQQVYDLNIDNKSWDGRGYNGEELPEGVYYFYLQAISNSGTTIKETGNITLLR